MVFRLLRWANVVVILLSFMAYLAPHVSPETCWPVAFIGVGYPWLLLSNLFFMVTWILLRRRYFLFSLACLVMGWPHVTGFVGFNAASPKKTPPALRIMTYNLAGTSELGNGTDYTRGLQQLSAFLARENCDILCFQEFASGEKGIRQLADRLQLTQSYPYCHLYKDKQVVIFSKIAFRQSGAVDLGPNANGCVYAEVTVNNKPLRVYTAHLQSNSVSSAANRLVNRAENGELETEKTLFEVKGILGKFRRTSKIRARQAQLLAAHIRQSTTPVVLAADLNETPSSYVYNHLTEKLKDAFREQGLGLGTTYGGAIPALRIDYVLASPPIRFTAYKTPRLPFSDHYPVIAAIAF